MADLKLPLLQSGAVGKSSQFGSPGSWLLQHLGDMGLQQSTECEWLDKPSCSLDVLTNNLQDIARVNRWFGGVALTQRALERVIRPLDPTTPLTILDVGTGLADIPVALCRWARQCGRQVLVTAVDQNSDILTVARAHVADWPEIVLVLGDARCLPYGTDSFDIVMCSLLLHHLSMDEATALLRQMGKWARYAVIVNDLLRHRLGYWISRLLLTVGTTNPLTRHDGPLSVKRAYTLRELFGMCDAAGLEIMHITHTLYYRVTLTLRSRGA